MKETLDVKNGQTADTRVRVSVKGALKTDSRAGQRSETMEETEKPVFIIFLLLGPKCKHQTVLL